MKRTRNLAWPTALSVAALLGIGALVPNDAVAQANPDDWQFRLTLYGYLPSISGTVNFPAPGIAKSTESSGISVNAADIIGALNFAFMGGLEARKGPWGLATDVMYLDLGASKSGTRDLSVAGGGLPASVSSDVHLDVRGTIWTLGGSYAFVSTPEATFEMVGGARLIDLKESLNFNLSADVGPFTGPGRQGSSEVKLNNWDGIIGARGRFNLGESRSWFVPYYADVGTGDSDLTWQAVAGIGYAFNWGELVADWRWLDYKFKSQDIENVRFNGPLIGVAFRW